MKKLLIILLPFIFAVSAMADCTVTVNWTPSTDAQATIQRVYYDPDNTVNGNEILKSTDLSMSVSTFPFTIPAGGPNDEVYVQTLNSDQTSISNSARMPVGGMAGATAVQTITICQ